MGNRRGKRVPVRKILLVDDVDMVLKLWARRCKKQGKTAYCATTRAEALEIARRERPQMAVVDLIMPETSGLDLVRELKKVRPKMFTVLVSGAMSADTAMHGLKAGADDCFDKDSPIEEIIERVQTGSRPGEPSLEMPTLDDMETQYIIRVLTDHNGNVTHTASALGIPRQSLQRKLRRLRTNGQLRSL